jgi:hypothetical protein
LVAENKRLKEEIYALEHQKCGCHVNDYTCQHQACGCHEDDPCDCSPDEDESDSSSEEEEDDDSADIPDPLER